MSNVLGNIMNRALINNILNDILLMPYFKNYAAASGLVHNIAKHEDAVADVFIKNGLSLWNPIKTQKKPKIIRNKKQKNIIDNQEIIINEIIESESVTNSWKNTVYTWIENPSLAKLMPKNSYISQPCGTHGNPDFIIKLDEGVVIAIECKTTTDSLCPMYNSGGIKQNYVYVFANERTNKTTIYMGRDIVTIEQQQIINELILKQRELEKEFNIKLKNIDIHERGVTYYTRPMIIQLGGGDCTDYFTHKEREICEKNVYKFIDDMIRQNEMAGLEPVI